MSSGWYKMKGNTRTARDVMILQLIELEEEQAPIAIRVCISSSLLLQFTKTTSNLMFNSNNISW